MVFYRLGDGFPHPLLEHCLRQLLTMLSRAARGASKPRSQTSVLDAVGHALAVAGSMTWQITWSLILGFTLSAVVQALVRRQTVIRLLGDDRPKTLAMAAGLGAASSSCSYAAVALARSLFRKGANFTAAMAFEIASTNLVIELGIILAAADRLAVHLGRVHRRAPDDRLLAVAFRLFVRQRLVERRPPPGRQGPGRVHGRPRGHGHEHRVRRQLLAAAAQPDGLHRGQPHLRHGMGRRHPRHRRRAC